MWKTEGRLLLHLLCSLVFISTIPRPAQAGRALIKQPEPYLCGKDTLFSAYCDKDVDCLVMKYEVPGPKDLYKARSAVVRIRLAEKSNWCTGSLVDISEVTYLLTAAHCLGFEPTQDVDDYEPKPIEVMMSYSSGGSCAPGEFAMMEVKVKVEVAIVNPGFDVALATFDPELVRQERLTVSADGIERGGVFLRLAYLGAEGFEQVSVHKVMALSKQIERGRRRAGEQVLSFRTFSTNLIGGQLEGGSSGAPLLNAAGEIVGILVETPHSAQSLVETEVVLPQ